MSVQDGVISSKLVDYYSLTCSFAVSTRFLSALFSIFQETRVKHAKVKRKRSKKILFVDDSWKNNVKEFKKLGLDLFAFFFLNTFKQIDVVNLVHSHFAVFLRLSLRPS